jgi:hypothetical protein
MKTIKKTATVSAATILAWLVAGIASAQTTTPGVIGTTTPGVPNTGGGDVLANIFLLATSAAIALIGLAYLSRKWANS